MSKNSKANLKDQKKEKASWKRYKKKAILGG